MRAAARRRTVIPERCVDVVCIKRQSVQQRVGALSNFDLMLQIDFVILGVELAVSKRKNAIKRQRAPKTGISITIVRSWKLEVIACRCRFRQRTNLSACRCPQRTLCLSAHFQPASRARTLHTCRQNSMCIVRTRGICEGTRVCAGLEVRKDAQGPIHPQANRFRALMLVRSSATKNSPQNIPLTFTQAPRPPTNANFSGLRLCLQGNTITGMSTQTLTNRKQEKAAYLRAAISDFNCPRPSSPSDAM